MLQACTKKYKKLRILGEKKIKKLKTLLFALSIMSIPTAVFASMTSDYWTLVNTQTEIYGKLETVSSNTCRGITQNISGNGIGVYVQTYATYQGQTIPNSTTVRTNTTGNYVEARTTTSYNKTYWGSGHSTYPTPDPYVWLYLSAN